MLPARRLATFASSVLLFACGAAPPQTAPPEVTVPPPPAASAVASGPPSAPRPPDARPADPGPGPKVTALPGSTIRFEGGDGSSKERAIRVMGAKGESDGVAAEYQYLELAYGKGAWKPRGQSLLELDGKKIDQLDLDRVGGSGSMTLYFDITDYFGKF
jgi:hypothetical protein